MTIQFQLIQKHNEPLYRQVADAIERDIFSGRLQPGEKLPPHRELADQLGVNVSTITRGYKEAEQKGLISGTVGKGTFISSDVQSNSTLVGPEQHAPGMLELGLINPLYHLDPNLEKSLKNLCRSKQLADFMQYSNPAGLLHHRAIGAEWASRYGLTANVADVVICAGAQHALTCALSGLFRAGDRIATDSLTYPGMKTLAAMLGIRLVPVEMDTEGMVPDTLDRICRREKIKGLYLMPGVQNPTTISIPENRRQQLAKISEKHQLTIIEDDAYALTLAQPATPMAALIPERSVFITGISKAMGAGLRVAFVVVPKAMRRTMTEAILNTIWMTPALNVELITSWIKNGRADEIINTKKQEAKERYKLTQKLLSDFSFNGLPTGFFIWLGLPNGWTGQSFEQRMREQGVNLFGVERFAVGNTIIPPAVRVSLTGTKDLEDLKLGLKKIRAVLKNIHDQPFIIAR